MDKYELFETLMEADPVGFRNEIMEVLKNMELYGGSFEKALAGALFRADMKNAVKIKTAFYDEWNKFLNWNKRG